MMKKNLKQTLLTTLLPVAASAFLLGCSPLLPAHPPRQQRGLKYPPPLCSHLPPLLSPPPQCLLMLQAQFF